MRLCLVTLIADNPAIHFYVFSWVLYCHPCFLQALQFGYKQIESFLCRYEFKECCMESMKREVWL